MVTVDRETGFNTQCYSEKKGHRLIEIRGTGKFNNDFAYLRVNDSWEKIVTKKGLTIFNLDGNLNILSQQTVDTTNISNHSQVSSIINSFAINTLFFIVSYDSITSFTPTPNDRRPLFYDYMVDALNSPNFPRINFNYDYKCSTPYVCAGVTGRGIMYEDIGSSESGKSNPHAFLQISYGDIESFGANGFGSNLVHPSYHVMHHNNSMGTNGTGTISVSPMKSSGEIRFEIRAKTRETITTTNNIEFKIKKNGAVIHTLTFTKNLPTRKQFETVGNTNDVFEIDYTFEGSFDVNGLWVYEVTNSNNNNFSFSKRTIASNGHIVSPIGVSPDDIDVMLQINDSPQNLPTNNQLVIGDRMVSSTVIGSGNTVTSSYIEIDPFKTYWFSAYANCRSNTDKAITVSFYFYDSNMLPTNVYTTTGVANSVSNQGIVNDNVFYLSIPIHGKYSKDNLDGRMFRNGAMVHGGLDSFDNINTIRMDSNTKYIKYAIHAEHSTHIALPCFLEQKLAILSNNKTLGDITEI